RATSSIGSTFRIRLSFPVGVLEALPELEVELPARIVLVEAVGVIEPERSERRDQGEPQTRAAVEPRGIELLRPPPHVAGIEERRQRDVVVEPDGVLRAHAEIRIAEAIVERTGIPRAETARGDG